MLLSLVSLLLFKMSMTVGKRVECSHQGGSPEPGHRYAVIECEIRYTCCRSTAAIVFMLPSLRRWLVVERPLEEQDVRLRFVNFVVLPAETLGDAH